MAREREWTKQWGKRKRAEKQGARRREQNYSGGVHDKRVKKQQSKRKTEEKQSSERFRAD